MLLQSLDNLETIEKSRGTNGSGFEISNGKISKYNRR